MWSFNQLRRSSQQFLPACIGVTMLLVLLTIQGCGYEPLYGTRSPSSSRAYLSSLDIAPVKDRLAQEVRNQLLDGLTPAGAPDNPRYRLSLGVEQRTSAVQIQIDDTTTRFNLIVTASFTLTEIASGKVLYSDSAKAEGSFNVVDSEFATVIAEKDAGREATRELSDEIQTLILVYFSRLGP